MQPLGNGTHQQLPSVTNITWHSGGAIESSARDPWGFEYLPGRIPTNPSRAVPGFDAAIHRPRGGYLPPGDRGSDLRDDVSETDKLACAGTSDGGYLFKGRDPRGKSFEITVTSSDLVSVPSGWITTITLQDGALDLNRGQEAKPAIRPLVSTAH